MSGRHEREPRAAYAPAPTINDPRPTTALLYYITDRVQLAGDETSRRTLLLERIEQAARAGVDFVQLRERDLSTRRLQELAAEATAAVERGRAQSALHGTSGRAGTRLLINSRSDVAIACGAGGVHLRSGPTEMGAAEARAIFHAAGVVSPIIAVSCHTPAQVALAAAEGADFAVFGPVFGKGPDAAGEEVAPTGIEALAAACKASIAGMPVLALGSITTENASACLDAGAAGLAGIRLFQSGDIAATVRALRQRQS